MLIEHIPRQGSLANFACLVQDAQRVLEVLIARGYRRVRCPSYCRNVRDGWTGIRGPGRTDLGRTHSEHEQALDRALPHLGAFRLTSSGRAHRNGIAAVSERVRRGSSSKSQLSKLVLYLR